MSVAETGKPRCWARTFRYAAALAMTAVAAYLALVAAQVEQAATVDETRPADAILVFGAAEYAGHPSPVFRARLDHAYQLFERGMAPLVITTGGGGKDPNFTEGGVGRDYLRSLGIPDPNLIAETQSDDTAESAVRTAKILRANHINDCVAVSDAYHMFRVKRLMQAQGMVVHGSPRPDSIPHTRFDRLATSLREACSYLLWKLHVT